MGGRRAASPRSPGCRSSLKGILTAEDARLACEHGAAAIVVSNHGGRQLDGVAATIDALPEVVEAVDGRIEVLVDGGIRRGTDVVKALALGARAVCRAAGALGPRRRRRGGRPRTCSSCSAPRSSSRSSSSAAARPPSVTRAHVARAA